ncbi:MAG: hypothetical protein CM1200mP18_19120 [Gammaproteobacteria bacterium]|nr:MAG: hypothetical protein CM1200mP18_19120 [Gammaproteobacteria bacterium]
MPDFTRLRVSEALFVSGDWRIDVAVPMIKPMTAKLRLTKDEYFDYSNRQIFRGGGIWGGSSSTFESGDLGAIDSGMHEYAVLIFRGQDINDEEQLALVEHSDRLNLQLVAISPTRSTPARYRYCRRFQFGSKPEYLCQGRPPEIFNLGNRLWHSDSSFPRALPAKYSLLSARSIPVNGPNTEYADMRAAYDALGDQTKAEVEGVYL